MAAGFICGISIAVYGKPWTLWLLFSGILLWPAIVTGHDRGMPESDRYSVRKRRWCMAVCSDRSIIFGLASLRGCAGGTKSISAVFGRWGKRSLFKMGNLPAKSKKNDSIYTIYHPVRSDRILKSVNGSAYLQASSSIVSPTPVLSDKRLFYMEK